MDSVDGKQGSGKYVCYAVILIACAIFYFARGDDILAWIALSIGVFSSVLALMYWAAARNESAAGSLRKGS